MCEKGLLAHDPLLRLQRQRTCGKCCLESRLLHGFGEGISKVVRAAHKPNVGYQLGLETIPRRFNFKHKALLRCARALGDNLEETHAIVEELNRYPDVEKGLQLGC